MDIISKLQTPSKGDVIWTFRISYFHCGIYEDENSVIHFASTDNASKSKETAVICKIPLEKFADGFPIFVIKFPKEKCFSPNEVISRAYSRFNETGYNLPLNNCDHFATWCKIGEHHSIQVDLAKKILVEAGKYLDKFRKKYTIFEEGAEILSAIYKIAEIFSSPEIKR